ncbi:hypothetical protein UlMin_009609 [Ulmus minor]
MNNPLGRFPSCWLNLQIILFLNYSKILKVGEELWKETLPLQMGSRLYQLQGLKPHTWYEVKISYPASLILLLKWAILQTDLTEMMENGKGYMLKSCDNSFSFNSRFYFSKHEIL